MIFCIGKMGNSSLRHDVVWITARETSRLEKVGDIGFGGRFAVDTVFILLETDGSTENDFVAIGGESIVAVVKDNLYEGGEVADVELELSCNNDCLSSRDMEV